MAYPEAHAKPSEVPQLGHLLLQRPMKRRWSFPNGVEGTHNPELRHRIQEAREVHG